MRSRLRGLTIAVGVIGSGAVLLSGPGTGCSSFSAESFATSADFCFIFDCQNGAFGGTVRPCNNANTVGSETQLPLFSDCPPNQ